MSSNRSVFPLKPSPTVPDKAIKAVDLFSEEGGKLVEVLASETARTVLTELSDTPATKADIAERVDTSLQNAHYHVDRLEEAGLVGVVGTHYSARGREMDVYALNGASLVLIGSDETPRDIADRVAEDAASSRR